MKCSTSYKTISIIFLLLWIRKTSLGHIKACGGDKRMNNQQSRTDAQKVKKQNAAFAQGQSTEFASETDAQEVRQQNQQSQSKAAQNSSNQQQQ